MQTHPTRGLLLGQRALFYDPALALTRPVLALPKRIHLFVLNVAVAVAIDAFGLVDAFYPLYLKSFLFLLLLRLATILPHA
jgi:hypothetical protein